MDRLELKLGDVVQLNENNEPCWVGCFMTVTKLTSDGAQGFILVPQMGKSHLSVYYRATWSQMEILHLRIAEKDGANSGVLMANAPLVPADEIESEGV